MNHKNIAIWVLSFSLFGAIAEVPSFFLGRVLGNMFLFGIVTFVICCIVSARKNKSTVQQPNQF